MGIRLLEFDGEDLRDLPLERHKVASATLCKRSAVWLALNDSVASDGSGSVREVALLTIHSVVMFTS